MFIEMVMEKFLRQLMRVEARKVRKLSDLDTQRIESKVLIGNHFHQVNLWDATAIK